MYHTARGRNVVTFLIFLLISTFFWFLMALNDELQRDMSLPVAFENKPEDVTLLVPEPIMVDLTIKDKGSALLRYRWSKPPQLKFNFEEVNSPGGKLVITPQRANNAIRSIFGQQATVVSLNPDSLAIHYTRRPGRNVSVDVVTGDISADSRYIISGQVRVLTDSVKLYSATRLSRSVTSVKTVPVVATDLTDSVTLEVPLSPPDGMRAVPASVRIRIPVEPLIARQRKVKISTVNVPAGKSVIAIPDYVEVSYLVPMSLSGDEDLFEVHADFRRRSSVACKMPLRLVDVSDKCHNVEISVDSVEFIVQQD